MQEINDHLHGRQVVEGDIAFNGLLEGDLVVIAGGHLDLRGTVTGNVLVYEGGKADIRGTVNGDVINNGGEVAIYGTVGSVAGTHPSHIDPEAVIQS